MKLAVTGPRPFGEHAKDLVLAQHIGRELERAVKAGVHVHGDHLGQLCDARGEPPAEIFGRAEKEGLRSDVPRHCGYDRWCICQAQVVRGYDERPLGRQVLQSADRQPVIELEDDLHQELDRIPAHIPDRSSLKTEGLFHLIRRLLRKDLRPREPHPLARGNRPCSEQFLDLDHGVLYGKDLGAERFGQADAEGLLDAHHELHAHERVKAEVELKVVVGNNMFLGGKGLQAGQELFCFRRAKEVRVDLRNALLGPLSLLLVQVGNRLPFELAQTRHGQRVLEDLEARDPLVGRKVLCQVLDLEGDGLAGVGQVHPAEVFEVGDHGGFEAALALHETDLLDLRDLLVELLELIREDLLSRGEHDHFFGPAGDEEVAVAVAVSQVA